MGLVRVFERYQEVKTAYEPVLERNQDVFEALEQRIASYTQQNKPLTVKTMETFGQGLELSYLFLLTVSKQGYFFNGGFLQVGGGRGGPYEKMDEFVRRIKKVLREQHRSSLGVNIVPLLYTVKEVPPQEMALREVQDFLEGQPRLREYLESFFSTGKEFERAVSVAAQDFHGLSAEEIDLFETEFSKISRHLH